MVEISQFFAERLSINHIETLREVGKDLVTNRQLLIVNWVGATIPKWRLGRDNLVSILVFPAQS